MNNNLTNNEIITNNFLEEEKQINLDIKKTKDKQESDFRKWLIKYKPKNAIMVPIETNTAAGIPDIFCCYDGYSCWIECKTLLSGASRIKGSQYKFFNQLYNAGGNAKVAIQRLNPNNYKPASIQIYNLKQIVTIPLHSFKISGKDILFPPTLKPYETFYYKRLQQKKENSNKQTLTDLYHYLLLDPKGF